MAHYKVNPSPMVLIVPLVIAVIVVIGAAWVSTTKNEVRSQAAWDPLKRCLVTCGNTKMIQDKAACSLDCPLVVEGNMTCTTFCQENVKERYSEGGSALYRSQIAACNNQCANWYGAGVSPTP